MNALACRILQEGAAELGVAISDELLASFSLLANELQKWNRKINLTAITGDEEIALKHFVDSLALCRLVSGDDELLDLGSGGGFPVLPLALVFPDLTAVSVDAVEKKIIFQRHAARLLGCRRFEAVHARGEESAPRARAPLQPDRIARLQRHSHLCQDGAAALDAPGDDHRHEGEGGSGRGRCRARASGGDGAHRCPGGGVSSALFRRCAYPDRDWFLLIFCNSTIWQVE